MKFPTFLHIASEGWIFLLIVTVCGGVAMSMGGGNVALAIAGLIDVFIISYFAEPDRRVPPYPLGVLAPTDGIITHRRECHDPHLDRAAIRISIRVSRFGAYYFRAPIEGTLLEVRRSDSSPHADRVSWIQTDEKDDILLVVSEGLTFGARPCQQSYGNRVGQGRRCGRRRLARQIDMFIPASSRVEVEVGDRVTAGTDRIATLLHNSVHSSPPPETENE